MKNTNKAEFFLRNVILENKAFFIMLLMAIVIGIIQPIFFTSDNLFNILRQVCSNMILAMGFTFVLGLGEIDLSVGAILGLNGVIIAKMIVEAGWGVAPAIITALLAGVIFGIINASIISALDIPPFIVTLATQSLFRGSSVRRADRIVVMDNGSIAAVGTHEELRKTCPIYQDICRSQIGEEDE